MNLLAFGLSCFLFFAVGALVGAFGIVRWWARQMNNPVFAKGFLKDIYRKSHPHWLQRSEDDSTRACPCCGWCETEGMMVDAAVGTVGTDKKEET